MYKIRVATEKFEEQGIKIIDVIEMLEAMTKHFERISEEKINNFIDRAKLFARMIEVDPETDFIRHRRR